MGVLDTITEEDFELFELEQSVQTNAEELEVKGWRAWYAEIFGERFVAALAPHHIEAIVWHWLSRMALRHINIQTFHLQKQLELGVIDKAKYDAQVNKLNELYPKWLAYFPIFAREHMKSTIARRMAVCDACLSVSPVLPPELRGGYCLYVSRNKEMVTKHAISIETLLTNIRESKVPFYYPELSQVKKNNIGSSKGWKATFYYTNAGFIFHFAGIEEGLAGGNVDDWRVTMLMLDDIDDRKDSPAISERRFNTLTQEVLPMAQKGTLTFFAQNLISRFSCMYRIYKGYARVLTDRKPTKPIPAFINLKTETKTIDGIVRDVIVAGEPTWHLFDKDRGQEAINREGLPAFLRERQHEVEQDRTGLVLRHYNDGVHVISRSQFESVYGTRHLPQSWRKWVFHDWSRTKSEYHACVAGILTMSNQNTKLPGFTFLFHCLSFPEGTESDDVSVRLLETISPIVLVGGYKKTWKEVQSDALLRTNLDVYKTNATELIEARRTAYAKIIPPLVKPILQMQNYKKFRMSHEAKKGVRTVYQKSFGIPFEGVNPGADGGVDFINEVMRVDYDVPHPFRPHQMGYTRFLIVAEDDLSQKPETINGVLVYPPKPFPDNLMPHELHDSDLCRYQFMNWRVEDPNLTVHGLAKEQLLKMNDDYGNGLMMLYFDNALEATPLTYKEKLEEATPERYRYEELLKQSPYEHGLTPEQEMTYVFQQTEAKKKVKSRVKYFGDNYEPIDEPGRYEF